MLWLYQRVFFGELTNEKNEDLADLNRREQWTLIPLDRHRLLGRLYPKPFLDRMAPTVDRVLERVAAAMPEGGRPPPAASPRSRQCPREEARESTGSRR